MRISTGVACGLTNLDKVLYEIFKQKYNNIKTFEESITNYKSFHKICRKYLPDNINDKNKNESQGNNLKKYTNVSKTDFLTETSK